MCVCVHVPVRNRHISCKSASKKREGQGKGSEQRWLEPYVCDIYTQCFVQGLHQIWYMIYTTYMSCAEGSSLEGKAVRFAIYTALNGDRLRPFRISSPTIVIEKKAGGPNSGIKLLLIEHLHCTVYDPFSGQSLCVTLLFPIRFSLP